MKTAKEVAPEGIDVQVVTLHNIPFFNQDLEEPQPPAAVRAFCDLVERADGVLVATPQYNRSYPGVLKNAFDWISRPAAARPLVDKPVAIMGATIGPSATAMAREKLTELLEVCKCKIMTEPQIGLTFSADHIAEDGTFSSEVQDEVRELLTAFAAFIEQTQAAAFEEAALAQQASD